MQLLQNLFGAKCAVCKQKIAGEKHQTEVGILCWSCNEAYQKEMAKHRGPFRIARRVLITDVWEAECKVINQMGVVEGLLAVAVGGGELHLVDPASFSKVAIVKAGERHSRYAYSPETRRLALSAYSLCAIFDASRLSDAKKIAELTELPMFLEALAFGMNGEVLAIVSNCWKSIRLVRSDDGTPAGELPFENPERVLVTPDGEHLIAGSHDGNVAMFDLRSQRKLWTTSLASSVEGFTLAPDGEQLVVSLGDSQGQLWVVSLADGKTEGAFRQEIYVENRGGGTFSSDGQVLVVPGGGGVKICHWPTRRILKVLRGAEYPHSETVGAALFWPSSNQLYWGSWAGQVTEWTYHPESLGELL